MQSFKVKAKMTSPYMQHRMDDDKLFDWEKLRGKIIERDDVAKEDNERAMFHSYYNLNGNLKHYIPSEHLEQSMIGAGTAFKSKVGASRKSMTYIVASMFSVTPLQIEIPPYDTIDRRSAVNKNIKGRVIVIRPKWEKLSFSFNLNVEDDTITERTVKEILEHAGRFVGIGSYRPTNKGKFGKFEVVKFNKVKT